MTPVAFTQEREALARLLASGVLSRSPNQEKILRYLCSKYFNGESQSLKEFHIATEALGRPDTFDPKTDSVVRVEMYRLRRRLRDHYAEHPEEPLRVTIPEKSYMPEFQPVRTDSGAQLPAVIEHPTALVAVETNALETPPTVPAVAKPMQRWMLLGGIAAAVAVMAGIAFLRPKETPSSAETPAAAASAARVDSAPLGADPASPIRIMAGRPPGRYIDHNGEAWEGDRYFKGGTAVATTRDVVARGFDANIFANMRLGDFQYEIPLAPGFYELMLLFAETQYGENNPLGGGESHRMFGIKVNGKPVADEVDVLSDAEDASTATARVFAGLQPGPDGMLRVSFTSSAGKAFVNAIVVKPGTAGKLRPVRIICRRQSFRDAKNNLWEADHFYRGGVQITRPHGAPVEETDLFRGERYGNFSYAIPVEPGGTYTVGLYFWEYWWGQEHPGRGGVGSRVFDVFCNHRPLLVDLDVVQRNPEKQVLVQTFPGQKPNRTGKLILDFVPKRNYAMVNAIEVLDEGKPQPR